MEYRQEVSGVGGTRVEVDPALPINHLVVEVEGIDELPRNPGFPVFIDKRFNEGFVREQVIKHGVICAGMEPSIWFGTETDFFIMCIAYLSKDSS